MGPTPGVRLHAAQALWGGTSSSGRASPCFIFKEIYVPGRIAMRGSQICPNVWQSGAGHSPMSRVLFRMKTSSDPLNWRLGRDLNCLRQEFDSLRWLATLPWKWQMLHSVWFCWPWLAELSNTGQNVIASPPFNFWYKLVAVCWDSFGSIRSS